ncbi:3'-5' exonuclease [Pantoea agglomerans]|uniref:3'-5' exonuclease n=1 Tax=Enterobacter agglomerans TaxID=549 RepID=UPI000B2AFB2A|nr:hypothetical protein [Pantoea agglomerans]WHU90636.1 hypothetical protein A7P62_22855 [Pantoea agglomerans pv. gypsophilae]
MCNSEIYVSVDIETSGPVPGIYSLLSIGACLVSDTENALYLELQPDSEKHDDESLAVTGLDINRLQKEGLAPEQAMLMLRDWLASLISQNSKPIFVGLNTPFDWSFINYYFHKYLGSNPFGFRGQFGYRKLLYGKPVFCTFLGLLPKVVHYLLHRP